MASVSGKQVEVIDVQTNASTQMLFITALWAANPVGPKAERGKLLILGNTRVEELKAHFVPGGSGGVGSATLCD
jgi:hypothetical protein